MNRKTFCDFLLPALVSALILVIIPAHAFERFVNYRSVTGVNDIVQDGSRLWLATTGGLCRLSMQNGSSELFTRASEYPDLDLTALVLDADGSLWQATRDGYLYHRTRDGRQRVISSYMSAGWDIRRMMRIGNVLVIASSKGCSVYDPDRDVVLKNATRFGSFIQPKVNTIAVHHDSLFLGLDEGIAAISVSGDKLTQYNFYDPSIWKTTAVGMPVISLVKTSQDILAPVAYPAVARSDGRIVSVRFSQVYIDSTLTAVLPDTALCIYYQNDGAIWFGTQDHYIQLWDGATRVDEIKIPGLTFDGVARVMADHTSRLWVLPFISTPLPWYKRITSFSNNTWRRFDDALPLGWNQPHFHAICEDDAGDIWFGTWGGGVHRYKSSTDSWSNFSPGAGMTTAAGMDSSRFLWFATNYNDPGCVVCLAPEDRDAMDAGRLKSFFGPTSPYFVENVSAINTDKDGRIFLGGMTGKLVHFKHNGHPEQGETAVTDIAEKSLLGNFSAIMTTEDGNTWLATGNGLYRYDRNTKAIVPVDKLASQMAAVVAEDDSIIWAGGADGLVRLELGAQTDINSAQSSQKLVGTIQRFGPESGLILSPVTDLNIDKKNGILWIGTAQGVSRMYLGNRFSETSISEASVYPNPFSIARDQSVVFLHIRPESQVRIYAATGNLMALAQPAIKNANEWTFQWSPQQTLIPGTYFYVVAPHNGKGIAQKLLVIP